MKVSVRTRLEPTVGFAHYATLEIERKNAISVTGRPTYVNRGAAWHFIGLSQTKLPMVMRVGDDEGKFIVSSISKDSITLEKQG